MLIFAAVFAFTFVTLCVAGSCSIDLVRKHRKAQARLARVVTPYTGPTYNIHGRVVNK